MEQMVVIIAAAVIFAVLVFFGMLASFYKKSPRVKLLYVPV